MNVKCTCAYILYWIKTKNKQNFLKRRGRLMFLARWDWVAEKKIQSQHCRITASGL